jgi:hypothetical protein
MAHYRELLTGLHELAEMRDELMRVNTPALPAIADIRTLIAAQRTQVRAAREALASLLAGP